MSKETGNEARLVIQRQAQRDLAGIRDYIAKDSPQRAHSFLVRIADRCRLIVERPGTGRIVRSRFVPEGTRKVTEGRYNIYFRKEKDKAITVLRVVHTSRNQRRALDRDRDRKQEARDREERSRSVQEKLILQRIQRRERRRDRSLER